MARRHGAQETFPRKAPKKAGALRRGAAFVVVRGNTVLLRTRPAKGLLGGMTEVPTSDWAAGLDDVAALAQAPQLPHGVRWHRRAGVVTHVFTHFPLELVVHVAHVPPRTRAPSGGRFAPIAGLDGEALPNLMRKVLAHGLGDAFPRAG
jgi:A/G-specific adenine glycosylase